MVYIIYICKILQKLTDRCDGHVAVGVRRCPMVRRVSGNTNFTVFVGESCELVSTTVTVPNGFVCSMQLNSYYREMVIADGYCGSGISKFVFVLKDESEDEYGLATANPYSLDLLEHYWREDYNYIESPIVGGELFLIVNNNVSASA